MKNDPRFCSACGKPLLKQDRDGLVLVIRCEECHKLVHERFYLNHHLIFHGLIGIITEQYPEKEEKFFQNENINI